MRTLILGLFCLLLVSQAQSQAFLQDSKEIAVKVVEGVIKGISDKSEISTAEIQACIMNSETFIVQLRTVVDLLRMNDASKIKDGLKKLGEALQILPDAITHCRSSEQEMVAVAKEITKILNELKSPLSFAFHIGKNLLVNGVDILHETTTAIQDWNDQNYEDFGVQVGRILFQLFISNVNGVQSVNQSSMEITLTVFQGVIRGFYEQGGVHIEDVQSCVSSAQGAVNDFFEGVRLISTKDAKKVQEGLRILGMALQMLPDALVRCEGAVAEITILSKKLTFVIAEIQQPQSFAFHVGKDLVVNGRDIYNEVNTAVADWNSQNYGDFGYQLGRALYQLFVGAQNMELEDSSSMQITLTVFQGVIRGFYEQGGVHIEDVQSCVSSAQGAVNDFFEGVRLISTKDAKKVQEGLRILGMALQMLPDALVRCEGAISEITILSEKMTLVITEIQQPQSFAFHVGKDLLINGRDIYQEVNIAVADWNSQNYGDFGYQLGRALYQLFVGLENQIQ